MMKIINYLDLPGDWFKSSFELDLEEVRPILHAVRCDGDRAVRDYTLKFDRVSLDGFRVGGSRFLEAYRGLDIELRDALELSAENLRIFSRKQLEAITDFELEVNPGVFAGQRSVPLESVGVYVPGGNFPLVSSLLMGAIPAREAGVERVVVCTPPGADGKVPDALLAAAYIAGVDELYTIGGAQAVGAMAYGTATVERVDKIVGPGNKYVTAAKKAVYGEVGIDFIAGPSEVLIVADKGGDPVYIAADLLAQAEHDVLATSILVTTSPLLAKKVVGEVNRRLVTLGTAGIARESLKRSGLVILVENMDQAVEAANLKAPEHLELVFEGAAEMVGRFRNYGSLFLGGRAGEVFGDYNAGLNHTLPTGGVARHTGGLSVRDFIKILTSLRMSEEGIRGVGEAALSIARFEGLDAHALAARVRLEKCT